MVDSTDAQDIGKRSGLLDLQMNEFEKHLLGVNDALYGLAGILCRIIVDANLVTKDSLAAMILARAGREDDPDFQPTLAAFARSIRMNLPGGRFDVIEGGRSEVDPGTT